MPGPVPDIEETDVALETVPTSGRRTRVGGWQRAWAKVAWGSGTEKGPPDLFVRQREGGGPERRN